MSDDTARNDRLVSPTKAWFADLQAKQAAARAEQRAAFFAEGRAIPDLVFATPECSVCGLHTMFDDGVFICEECDIVWPQSGYGHEAERTHIDDLREER